METQTNVNFQRIENAIGYIRDNFKEQPNLDVVAEYVNLSPYHFQRMFKEWAGVSPKKFLQYTTTAYAKNLLTNEKLSLSEASYQTGLSSSSRLHDLFIKIEGMTPAEYKHGGKNLSINYSFADSPFGEIIVASTRKGICHLAFSQNKNLSLAELKDQFPNAKFNQYLDMIQQNALFIFSHNWKRLNEIKLHLRGTDFQLKVWETLIKIPQGKLSNYGQIANQINKPKASRAVGSAVGDNPVAYLIPCHRVIRSNGQIGEYHWGSDRKIAMIGWEVAQTS